MTIIHMYAIVDNSTNTVIGKYVGTTPNKMQNISYTMMKTDESGTNITEGTAFLSKAKKFWDEVQDPLYLTTPEQMRTTLYLEGM